MVEDVLRIRDFAVRYGTRRGPRSIFNTRGTVYYQGPCYRSDGDGFITAVMKMRQKRVNVSECGIVVFQLPSHRSASSRNHSVPVDEWLLGEVHPLCAMCI